MSDLLADIRFTIRVQRVFWIAFFKTTQLLVSLKDFGSS